MPPLECTEAAEIAATGNDLEADLASGTIINPLKGNFLTITHHPKFVMEIPDAGGLIEQTRKAL